MFAVLGRPNLAAHQVPLAQPETADLRSRNVYVSRSRQEALRSEKAESAVGNIEHAASSEASLLLIERR